MLLDMMTARGARLSPAHDGCRSCADRPALTCACCDRPAVIATLADRNHSVSWCQHCWRDLQAIRGEDPREGLTWWVLGKRPRVLPDRADEEARVA
jgi:hypothetical protein